MSDALSSIRKDSVRIHYIDDDDDDIKLFNVAVAVASRQCAYEISLCCYQSSEQFFDRGGLGDDVLQVVFLEVNMRNKSGFEVLREIRTHAVARNFPVVMFSTSSAESAIEASRLLGASNYISSRGSLARMADVIVKAIERQLLPDAEEDFLIK